MHDDKDLTPRELAIQIVLNQTSVGGVVINQVVDNVAESEASFDFPAIWNFCLAASFFQ